MLLPGIIAGLFECFIAVSTQSVISFSLSRIFTLIFDLNFALIDLSFPSMSLSLPPILFFGCFVRLISHNIILKYALECSFLYYFASLGFCFSRLIYLMPSSRSLSKTLSSIHFPLIINTLCLVSKAVEIFVSFCFYL